ncbi:hypothetical protein GCM10023088_09320 [Actinomadura verrucosospora]|uniref:hypothetical protein n=1 Tax=Actinomadura verrucosospora TaxID=46165 RepID=UPI0031ED74F8
MPDGGGGDADRGPDLAGRRGLGSGAWPLGGPGEGRIEVYQATGMVAVQLGVGLIDTMTTPAAG